MKVNKIEEFIKIANRPIIIENDTLGTLELRPIFNDDLNFLFENINECLDEELLCKRFIINQLNSPEILIENLNELEQHELKNILEKYLKYNNMDEFFNLSDATLYDDFKEGVINYMENIVKPSLSHHEEIIKSVHHSLNSLNIYGGLENYVLNSQINAMEIMAKNSGVSQVAQNLKYMGDISSPINDSLNKSALSQAMPTANYIKKMASITSSSFAISAVSQAASTVDSMHRTADNINYIFNKSAISYASEISKAIQPQINIWNEWINNNHHIFKFYEDSNEFWKNVKERYDISKKRALSCIKKYHWFISPSMDPSIVYNIVFICESNSKSKWGEINHVFNDYFLDNECENLNFFVKNWESNPIFKGRMKIIKDCVEIIKNNPTNLNSSNLVVPSLISQIDGIQKEFMNQRGLKVDKNIVCDLEGNRKKDEHGQNIKFERYIRDLTSNDEFLDAMNDVFLDVLFQHTMPGEDYKTSIKFSRHKIMHGENFRYGRKDYVMRCFMILDFLHGLSLEN